MVAIGIYLRVLYVLQLDDDDSVAGQKKDKLEKLCRFEFEDKERASKKE